MFYVIYHHDLKLEMEKKLLFSISSKYSYFKPVFNYIRKDFEKELYSIEIVTS